MHIILKPLINNQIYKDFYNKNDYIEIKSELDWENFLFQNKKKKNSNFSENFKYKRINKNIKGFEDLLTNIEFNKEILDGFFVDYSSFVNIFLYFKSEKEIIDYVNDTLKAWGERKSVKSFESAKDFLKDQGVVLSTVKKIFINKDQWNFFHVQINNKIKKEQD